MFKTNSSTRTPDSSLFTPKYLEALAKQKGLIKRTSSKFSATAMLYGLLKSVVSGDSSFSDMACYLEGYQKDSISRQAVHKRIGIEAADFMESITTQLLTSIVAGSNIIETKLFNRVILEDASIITMHDNNAKHFKSIPLKDRTTAAFKIDFAYDLLTGTALTCELIGALDNDKRAGARLVEQHVLPGDLVLRDMGYYSLERLVDIEERGAFWLSKLPTHIHGEIDGGDLNELLANTSETLIDREVYVSKRDRKKVRLIAVKASEEQANRKRVKARRTAKRHGKVQRKYADTRNSWHILVTNVDANQMEASDLITLYRVRWQIETVFKAWKQSLKLRKCFSKSSNPHHQRCLIYASLIVLLLSMKLTSNLQARSVTKVSVNKVSKHLTQFIARLKEVRQLASYRPKLRQVLMDKRKRISSLGHAEICLS